MNALIRCAALVASAALVACNASQSSSTQSNDAKRKTFLEEQADLNQLRAQMRPIARQVAMRVPLDCDFALAGITDPTMRATLLDIAANAGIYTVVRVDSPDPRVGLADLLVTGATVAEALTVAAQSGPYPTLTPMIATFSEFKHELDALAQEWLPDDVLAQVEANIAQAKAAGVQQTSGMLRVVSLLVAKPELPASLQVESSFISFDDGGLLERGLGEVKKTQLGVRQVADIAALLPQALEYRMKRVLASALADEGLVEMRRDLSAIADDMKRLDALTGLESLKHLEALSKLDALTAAALGKLDHLAALDRLSALDHLSKLDGIEHLRKLETLETLDALQPLAELREARLLIAGGLFGGLALQAGVLAWALRRR